MPLELSHPLIAKLDSSVDSAFGRLRGNRVVDRTFYAASEAANHSLLWHGITWGRVLAGKSDWRTGVRISAILGVESALVNGPVKSLFRRTRPEHDTDRPHKLRNPKTSSFPSGHATSAMCASALLTADGVPAPAVYALAGVVALSRIHVRIHHASDVVAGAAIGAAFGAFAKRNFLRGGTFS